MHNRKFTAFIINTDKRDEEIITIGLDSIPPIGSTFSIEKDNYSHYGTVTEINFIVHENECEGDIPVCLAFRVYLKMVT